MGSANKRSAIALYTSGAIGGDWRLVRCDECGRVVGIVNTETLRFGRWSNRDHAYPEPYSGKALIFKKTVEEVASFSENIREAPYADEHPDDPALALDTPPIVHEPDGELRCRCWLTLDRSPDALSRVSRRLPAVRP